MTDVVAPQHDPAGPRLAPPQHHPDAPPPRTPASAGTPTALLLVDLQRDYLDRPGLIPDEATLLAAVAALLASFRAAGAPVAHVRTIVRPDGSDVMPHWRTSGMRACVAGTPGADPPAALAELPGELVASKQHYRGFADPALDAWLRGLGVERVVIGGIYTHACVRETALDAYERGYDVVIAADAVASDDAAHAEATYRWLDGRAATFRCSEEIAAALPVRTRSQSHIQTQAQPHAAGAAAAAATAAAASAAALAAGAWAGVAVEARARLLDGWAAALERRHEELVAVIVDEVAKPRPAARDEVRRAVAHVRTAAALARQGISADELVADGVLVRHAPVGVVGILMPWNNPLALPCGKIAPALAFGNGVVFKPAPEGARTAALLMKSLAEAGLPVGLVALVTGGAAAGAAVVREPLVDAVAVTGSIATGRAIAAACAARGIPLQAELGGNNAAIVLADADLDAVVPALVRNAFAFAGQRCTAIRRFVVEAAILDEFTRRAVDQIIRLRVGEADDDATDVGPLISAAARDRVAAAVGQAVADGSALLAGGRVPMGLEHGPWYSPTLLRADDPGSAIVQVETFGPVAVIQPARDLDDAIGLANGVEQGLLMAILTGDPAARDRALAQARVGIVQLGPWAVPVHADAPFGGWKASGLGPPEHGRWDAQFLTRPQAVYDA